MAGPLCVLRLLEHAHDFRNRSDLWDKAGREGSYVPIGFIAYCEGKAAITHVEAPDADPTGQECPRCWMVHPVKDA